MSEYTPPIQPPQPVEGWPRIEPIKEDEAHERFNKQIRRPPFNNQNLALPLLSLLHQGLSTLLKRGTLAHYDQEEAKKNLLAFQKTLLVLTAEDHSHDPSFTLHFSSLWHKVIDNFNMLEENTGKDDPSTKKLRALFDAIESYPPWEEHTLGFYLSHHGGETWYPIPFMETLYSLHLDAQNSPEKNILLSWSQLISEAIELLKYSLP